ncbi:hypothetical protein V8B55DRAFT_1444133 [Mucor lusitanicus]|uniref:Uncharacterized protein n=2 Tax=Mucor circinelloides f. lusitanicus TaxID=29924 RepID=A0A162TVG1_MUCCL|nr:hypothetical protein FB192DRAFT_1457623 [Mucor lusitanicus]OAD07472.1 hypothetical protein MUCCIDRAFT_104405 [Mucor lusitanicus CBS 277.49]
MKFLSLLAILSVAVLVSAAPCRDSSHHHGDDNSNYEDNSNHEDNSSSGNKHITQNIGSVGSSGGNKGLLSGLLGNGLLSSTTNNNYVNQKAEIN